MFQRRARKATEIVYLGKEVSAGLSNLESNAERLKENDLPFFRNIAEL